MFGAEAHSAVPVGLSLVRRRRSPARSHPTEPSTWGKWPPASKQREWHQFGEDTAHIISSMWKGDVDSLLQAMSTVIMSYRTERFGQEEEKSKEDASHAPRRR